MVERMERGGDADEYEVQDQINPRTGEKVGQRMKLKSGTTLGFEERDWNHKGEPVEFVGERKDYGDGVVELEYAVRASNGRIETYRQTFERDGNGREISRGSRRIYE
jgi:hypothetical protein